MPNIKDLTALTAAQLDQADQEIVRELCEKYGIAFEGGEPLPEEQETGAEEPLETPEEQVQEAVEGTEEHPEEAAEALAEAAIPPEEVPADPNIIPAEEVPAEPMVEVDPIDEIKGLVGSVAEEIAALKAEIESLKSTLEGVAVREPIGEKEADALESEESLGQRVKGSPANQPEKNVTNDFIKKLGGFSR
jgi:hypothetical protein